ncbi:2-hydroxyacyl-CoA dehydratase subunit D [Anaeromicropila populeti]|uniref:Benzoyl-CoA reductase/2-hydroxyglutaryl-CoA dehydratase subunit, BcrC/BadD/HgdB n=1 Tax=Anaeromicropila populeti TaxID=37658 RepID=A0A1I6LIV4_9FIRM|nr:2-hydroxyacyl-CoA dehydratase family protein [Anaeromicropila populeti]SFS03356.1 Benzoyl-CoA reductase/2-hydroxyglutaryl-CoA dehydratase subunit, BcrC/BadD/HgdB [Anaeromicropila populeti]
MSINKQNQNLSQVEQRQRERFISKSTKVAAKYLRRMEELPGAPDEIKPYFEVLRNIYVEQMNIPETNGKKAIGTYCVMVPQELIYAAGAIPVKLCSGSYTAFSIGDDVVPRDACPLVKAVVGFQTMGTMPIYRDCALMVVPVTCDCKKKIAGMLGEMVPTFSLHVPSSKSEDEDMEQFVLELYQLIKVLEQATGQKVTYESLIEGMEQVAYAQYEFSRFLEYRRQTPALIKGTHVMAMMNAYSYMPVEKWSSQLKRLNARLEQNKKNKLYAAKENQPRIMITGSPVIFPNIKLPLLIEEMGGSLIGDETCMGERMLYDPVAVVDESFDGLIRAIANRYTRPCTCPTFVDNTQRIYRIKQMIKDQKVQGVIYHVLRGCLVYDYEYQVLEEELGKIGIPVIRVESDYNEEDIEQLRIRIEAFIEMIKLGGNKNGR